MTQPLALTASAPPRRGLALARWMWWLPRIAFVLFIAAVAALLWYGERTVREEQRATLLSDMLWLEQNLQFALSHNEELMSRLDPQTWREAGGFEAHVTPLLANDTGLRRIAWRDGEGRLRQSAPHGLSRDDTSSNLPRLAQSLGRAVYSDPYPSGGGDWEFEVDVPLFQGGRHHGTAVGVYSLPRLLEKTVPWWLTERYRIEVRDRDGRLLARRSQVGVRETDGEYQIALDPPGKGLLVRALPYKVATPLASKLLSAALVLLALAVLGSFWVLRRHVQRREAAETALHDEVTFRKAMEDSLHTGLRARDLEGRVTYVNPAFCQMVGWSAAELVGRRPPMPYWADEFMEETRAMNRRVLAGESPAEGFEMRFRRRDGEYFDALIHEAPLIDAQGRQTGWMGSVVDITERKRAEETARAHAERLQASARLVTMGEMASSLAHELNQPLAAITSYLTGCRNLIAAGGIEPDELDGALRKGQEQAQRAAKIIRRIYEFVRRHEPKSEPCDLGGLVGDLLALIEPEARRSGVRLALSLQARAVPPAPSFEALDLPVIRADRVLLTQALLNLLKNGIDAMRATPAEQRELTLALDWDEAEVRIEVADRGAGIAPETAARLFEPFFTTKAEGLGVGLAICRSVIEAHHGRLWHDANNGGGSRFHLSLPRTIPAS